MLAPDSPRPTLWRQETNHLARSGLTLAFNQLLQIAIPFVTTSMTGRLGVDALAAGSLVGSIGLLLFVSALGVLQGLVPLIGIGIGAGDERAAARAIRGGLVIAIVMGLSATAIMACVPWALVRTGPGAGWACKALHPGDASWLPAEHCRDRTALLPDRGK